MLEIKSLNLNYGASQALRGVSLSAKQGEVACVLGKNGVGKTTLLNAIMGLERIRSGDILLDDKSINNEPAYARSRSGVALVPQGRDIFSQLTVEENLRIGLSGLPRPEKIIPSSLFQYFPVLGEMLNRKGGDLSGGQQQQLAIARALVVRPRVLLLDEPTNDLDVETLFALEYALDKFSGCAMIISHDRWFLDRICTHILAFEGDSNVEWFEGSYSDYSIDRKNRLGDKSEIPSRIKYKKFSR